MYSILSKNGYGILKSALDEYKLESIKKDLTMVPKINFDIGASKKNNSQIEITASSRRYYGPRRIRNERQRLEMA